MWHSGHSAFVGEAVVVALLLLLASARCGAACTTPCARRHAHAVVVGRRSRGRPMPLPCAIQVPEQARITGSSAVTSPLAGRCTDPCRRAAHVDVGLAVGDDDDLVAAQPIVSNERNAAGVHVIAPTSCDRRSLRRSRSIARRSPTSGCSSGLGCENGRMTPSPRSIARTPATQPRQLICAISNVISASTSPSPVNSSTTPRRVSSLRWSTKLMSCTIINVAPAPTAGTGTAVICNLPLPRPKL